MEKQKVKVTIAGGEYFIVTQDSVERLEELAEELDKNIQSILAENANLSLTQAAVLSALNFSDAYKKADESADSLRGQINGYIEEATRAKFEQTQTEKEVQRLKAEIQRLEKILATK